MAQRTFLYHKDYAPEGQIFDLEKVSEAMLVEQGWVDNPGKLGINIWTGDHAAMAELKNAFEKGDVAAIGSVVMRTESDEKASAVRERNEAFERMRVLESENERLTREKNMAEEKLEDHRSDARKIEVTDSPSAARTPVGNISASTKPAKANGAGLPATPAKTSAAPPAGLLGSALLSVPAGGTTDL